MNNLGVGAPIPHAVENLCTILQLTLLSSSSGISFEEEMGQQEEIANKYAENTLIPPEKYQEFISRNRFDLQSVKSFANQIERDPGIVFGRLQNDKKIEFDDWTMKSLRHKYKVKTVI